MISGDTLVPDVMEREAHPGMMHAEPGIHLIQQHRDKCRLPIVAVDDFRVFVGLEHELQGGTGEKRKPRRVIILPVDGRDG